MLAQKLDLALLLSVEALRITPTVEARSALISAIEQSPKLHSYLPIHGSRVSSVQFTPDGERLFSAMRDGRVIEWEIGSGEIVAEAKMKKDEEIRSFILSPDGCFLALGCSDGSIQLWESDSLITSMEFHEQSCAINSLAFSPDGQRLASASMDKTICIWDVKARRLFRSPIRETASSLVFGLDGSKLFFARFDLNLLSSDLQDNGIYGLDVESGEILENPLLGHRSGVTQIATDAKRRLLASVGTFSTFLWDLAECKMLMPKLEGHKDFVWALAVSSDGKLVATGSSDQTVIVWGSNTRKAIGEPLRGHTASVQALAFDPRGSLLASGSEDSNVLVWDLRKSTQLRVPFAIHPEVNRAIFSPDGTRVITCGNDRDNSIVIWDAKTGAQITRLLGHENSVNSVSIHRNGERLVSGSSDNTVRVWSFESEEPVFNPVSGEAKALAVSFSPKDDAFATAYEKIKDQTALVVMRCLGRPSRVQQTLAWEENVRDLAFCSEGRYLVASTDHDLWVWDWKISRDRPRVLLSGSRFTAVAFSAFAKILAATTSVGTVHFFRTPSFEPLGTPLQAHTVPLTAIAFREDGELLATGASDGSVVFWDVASRTKLGTASEVNTHTIVSLDFSLDGTRLLSAGYDGLITLWDVSEDSWAERALSMANRRLTSEEISAYSVEIPADPSSRDLTRVTSLPLGSDLVRNQGELRGKASSAEEEFLQSKAQERRRLEEALDRKKEAKGFEERGDYAESLAGYNDTIAIFRELSKVNGLLTLDLAHGLYDRGACLFAMGRTENAIADMTEALNLFENDSKFHTQRREQSTLLRPFPSELDARRGLANVNNDLGVIWRSLTNNSRALEPLFRFHYKTRSNFGPIRR